MCRSTDSVVVGLAGVAAFGLGLTIGAWLLPIAAVIVMTSPWAHGLITRWPSGRKRRQGFADAPRALDVRDGTLETWTDAELYAVWHATIAGIAETADSPKTVTGARARQLLLAEIERRYPTETHAWLSSNAALNGEPPHFLRPPRDG